MPINYLIPYVPIKGHKDPDFKEMSYGDSGWRGDTLKSNVTVGSYLFFHTKIGNTKYITSYIVVKRIVSSEEAQNDPNINCDGQYDDWLFIGNKVDSKRLRKPIPFNKSLANKLSLGIDFSDFDNGVRTELQVIASATRSHRQLTGDDVDVLISEIDKYQKNNKIENTTDVQYHLNFYDEGDDLVPFDEVHKIRESEIQKLIRKNPSIIENGLKVVDYEKVLPDGDRLDLLLEDEKGALVLAELKGPDKLTDEIPTQLASYLRDIQIEYPDRHIRKMVICDGKISPKLEKACEALGIEIMVYGFKLDCFKLSS